MRTFASPGRYVQGPGALDDLGEHVGSVGARPLVVADERVQSVVGDRVAATFERRETPYEVVTFREECTTREIERVCDVSRERDADVVVGVGGGKTLDVAKAVRARVGGGMVSVPTVASTDAPTSSVTVLYDESGRWVGGEVHDRHPDRVVVDTAVLAAAPTRWFRSGVGDALATRYEAEAAHPDGRTLLGGAPTRAGLAVARECDAVVRADAVDALAAVDRDEVTPAVERVVEAVVLLSGLGFESGGLAAAHAVHDGLAVVGGDATHGEKVGFGVVAQLVLEDRPDEARAVADFLAELGLPRTLGTLGVEDDDETLARLADVACRDGSTIWNEPVPISLDAVVDAVATADRIGQGR